MLWNEHINILQAKEVSIAPDVHRCVGDVQNSEHRARASVGLEPLLALYMHVFAAVCIVYD